jgi:hypothetical protein
MHDFYISLQIFLWDSCVLKIQNIRAKLFTHLFGFKLLKSTIFNPQPTVLFKRYPIILENNALDVLNGGQSAKNTH